MAEQALGSMTSRDTSAADRRLLFVHLSERRLSESESESAQLPWNAALQDGTSIMGESLLRLACDSGLIVAKTDAKGSGARERLPDGAG